MRAPALVASLVALSGLLSWGAAALAQTPPPACGAPEHRQFDFWLGEWDVTNAQAKSPVRPPSKSHISRLLNGCALLEEFENPRGYSGKSLNFYSGADRRWHQTWIDTQGAPLFLEGGLQGKSMVLEDGGAGGTKNRITWTPLEGGRVRQLWETSKDGGKTWSPSFDGLYTPQSGAEPHP